MDQIRNNNNIVFYSYAEGFKDIKQLKYSLSNLIILDMMNLVIIES